MKRNHGSLSAHKERYPTGTFAINPVDRLEECLSVNPGFYGESICSQQSVWPALPLTTAIAIPAGSDSLAIEDPNVDPAFAEDGASGSHACPPKYACLGKIPSLSLGRRLIYT